MKEPGYYPACENCKHKLKLMLSNGIETTCFYEMYLIFIHPNNYVQCSYANEEEVNK